MFCHGLLDALARTPRIKFGGPCLENQTFRTHRTPSISVLGMYSPLPFHGHVSIILLLIASNLPTLAEVFTALACSWYYGVVSCGRL